MDETRKPRSGAPGFLFLWAQYASIVYAYTPEGMQNMMKTIGVTVLAGCVLWATPALAQSASSAPTLDIMVRGKGSVSQEAQEGVFLISGNVSTGFDWDAFRSGLIEQTSVTALEQSNGWVLYPPLSSTDEASEQTPVFSYFEGSADEISATLSYVSDADLDVSTSIQWITNPTPETESRAVERATADARNRAVIVASSAGCNLVRLSSIELIRIEPSENNNDAPINTSGLSESSEHSTHVTPIQPLAFFEAHISASFLAQCP